MPIHIDLSKSNLENTSDKDKKVKAPAVLASERGRNIFQKLSAGAKELYLNLQEKAEKSALNIKTIDKAQLMWNGRLLERHERKSAELSTQISRAEKDAALLEKAAGNRASFLEEFKKKHPDYSGDLSKLERETVKVKQDFQKRIEKISQTKDKLETKLQYRNDKKAVYENKRKTIVEGVSEKIGERLSPHEKRMEKLQGRKEKLETEINDFTALKDNFHQEVEELEADLSQANFRVERKMLKEAISLIKKELRGAEKNIETRHRQKITIETRLAKINKKANKWRDLRNAFIRVSRRQVEFQAVHKKDEVIAGRSKKDEPTAKEKEVIRAEAVKDIFAVEEEGEESKDSSWPLKEAEIDSNKEEYERATKTEKTEATIPFVITQDVRQQLADLGWGREQQRDIDPLRAQEIIKNQETYKKPEASRPPEAGSAEGSLEVKEQVGAKSSLSSYLDAWNALAGRNYRINPGQFIKFLNIPQDLAQQEIALETLEGFVRGYYSRLKEGGEKNIFEGSGLKRQLKVTAQRLGLKE